MTQQLLRTTDLSVGYGHRAVVKGLDIHVDGGEVVVLLGANGAGKSTTLLTLAGELPPISGAVEFLGSRNPGGLARRVKLGLAFLPEEKGVFRRLTVHENLRLGRCDPEAAYESVPELRAISGRQAGLCSGGEQQIICLARAMAAKPRLFMADELSFGLAPRIVKRMLADLRRAADEGAGVLIVEQHANQALSIADRGYVIARGRITLAGSAAELQGRLADVAEAYLGGKA
jgi:branched-chain amino acid transport system ATP-binding protein